jgi:photosystem II stability/assembly factor-like uncharacterized protein
MTASWLRSAERAGAAVLITLAGLVVAGSARTAAAEDLAATAGSVLRAVSCSSTSACFAVGGSTGVTTTDAGAHWTRVASPPGVFDLTGVSCWSATRCLVVGSGNGDAGAIYRTSDGGMTWRTLPAVLPGGFFLAISCPSRDVCVATGNSGAIFSTADGGRTWHGQFRTEASLINGIDCVSTTVCEAVGYSGGNGVLGLALRTTDGGRTWVPQQLPAAITFPIGVACPSVTTCTTVGQTTIRSGSVQVGVIAATTDGGTTWHRQRVPTGYTYLAGVACPQVGLCAASGYGPQAITATVDGGHTWTPQGPRHGAFLPGLTCATPSICVAVGETRFGFAAIYRTDDGGQRWERQPIGTAA